MKRKILKVGVLLLLAACSDEIEPTKDYKKNDGVTEEVVNTSNARTPEGSGSGVDATSGVSLTWNGDGRWYGPFAGTFVWFYGPTPTELQNGIQGEWPVACPLTPACYANGFTASGNGANFVVTQPACGGSSPTTITMQRLTITKGADGKDIIEWKPVTRTVTSLSSTDCKLIYYGKVIVNTNCKPIIVDKDSTYPANLCGMLVE